LAFCTTPLGGATLLVLFSLLLPLLQLAISGTAATIAASAHARTARDEPDMVGISSEVSSACVVHPDVKEAQRSR
jgi:hypothetical protein